MRQLVLALAWCLFSATAEAANLCVKTGGSDATAKASLSYIAGNEAGSTCWATLGRAAWGNASRATPNSGEGASAGDVVYVFGGTYDYSATVIQDRFVVLYNPVNSGSVGNYITFTCVGSCTLTAEDVESPIIGADGVDYIKWYADIGAGHAWVISACKEWSGDDPTDNCPAGTVATDEDTGPIVCHVSTGCWVEGVTVSGSTPQPFVDQWNAIRWEYCDLCVAKNNTISNFTRTNGVGGAVNTNQNQSCFTLYAVTDSTIEHNQCTNTGAFVYFKNTGSTTMQDGNIVRLNWIETTTHTFSWSHVSAGPVGRSFVYQNISVGSNYCVYIIDATDDWIVNNVCLNADTAAVGTDGNESGVRVWNNIVQTAALAIAVDAATMPADTVLDVEHNVYHSATTFYNGSDGNRTFASFNATYTDQNTDAPDSITSDPLFANTAGSNYRLCTSAGVPAAGCSGASPALTLGVDTLDLDGDSSTIDTIPAGAYITGNETIGLLTGSATGAGGRWRIRRGEQ